ncbi:MAG: hypothetical protein RBT64_13935 [Trichloromonas sp.]|jgi:hypothetical protein|nr:hypothetical protein [Trichloromonas sp.]
MNQNTEVIITKNDGLETANLFIDGHNPAAITGERIVIAVSTKTKQVCGIFAYMGNTIVGQFHNLDNPNIRDNR